MLAYLIAGLLQAPDGTLKEHCAHAIEVMERQFADRYGQAAELADRLNNVLSGVNEDEDHREKMEQLHCYSAAECLAGAMYACCSCNEDFDTAMILSVNHSGRSAAVGALTGAILGAKLGYEALPEFYLESLEVAQVLEVLARDLAQGSPSSGLFDDDWDLKYIQGVPPGKF